jgi:formylglycine-generating enzyme required for sulfatase activity
MEFVLIPPGEFVMGSPTDEPGRADDEVAHRVRLTKAFYLAKHETMFTQFRAFVEETKYDTDGEKNGGGHAHDEQAEWKHRAGTNWRKPGFAGEFKHNDRHPVVHVSHTDALAFAKWLASAASDEMDVTLPTEAEWEWACRAGTATRFTWGEDVDATGKVANVGDERLKEVQPRWPREIMPMNDGHAFLAPVGSYRANGFQLHDMLGNVWEFCSTRAGPYPREDSTDPGDLATGRGFAVRGGGWSNIARDVRSATRNADPPHFCHSNLGFRVTLKLKSMK